MVGMVYEFEIKIKKDKLPLQTPLTPLGKILFSVRIQNKIVLRANFLIPDSENSPSQVKY